MNYNYKNPSNKIRAAGMLRRLMPQAIERVAKTKPGDLEMEAASEVGRSSLHWYTDDKCTGIHIYQGDKGGWFADFAFTDLPAGIPDCIGTPSAHPERTREDAVKAAITMLAMTIIRGKMDRPDPTNVDVTFALDELAITLPSELIAKFKEVYENESGRLSTDFMETRFEQLRREHAGGKPFTSEIMSALTDDAQKQIYVVCGMALAMGWPRWPAPPESAPPPSKSSMN